MGITNLAAAQPEGRPQLRRNPNLSILHQIVQRHGEAFWSACEQSQRSYPAFVQRQIRAFERCGDPRHGFARIYCPHCRREELLAFSCKVRELCPCCCARRMNAQAATSSTTSSRMCRCGSGS